MPEDHTHEGYIIRLGIVVRAAWGWGFNNRVISMHAQLVCGEETMVKPLQASMEGAAGILYDR